MVGTNTCTYSMKCVREKVLVYVCEYDVLYVTGSVVFVPGIFFFFILFYNILFSPISCVNGC